MIPAQFHSLIQPVSLVSQRLSCRNPDLDICWTLNIGHHPASPYPPTCTPSTPAFIPLLHPPFPFFFSLFCLMPFHRLSLFSFPFPFFFFTPFPRFFFSRLFPLLLFHPLSLLPLTPSPLRLSTSFPSIPLFIFPFPFSQASFFSPFPYR